MWGCWQKAGSGGCSRGVSIHLPSLTSSGPGSRCIGSHTFVVGVPDDSPPPLPSSGPGSRCVSSHTFFDGGPDPPSLSSLPQDLVLGALAPTLSLAGVRRLAVSVDDDDAAAKLLWAGYGFTPLQV